MEEMMKKLWICMCIGAMTLGLAACGSRNEDNSASESSSMVESSSVQESTENAEQTSAEQDGETEEGWSEEMTSLRAAVVDALGDDYWPTMQMPAEYLEMTYGLTEEMYADYMGEMPVMSVHVDTLLIVKAAEGQEDAVLEALQNYQADLIENSIQYPGNVGKVQASKVERIGNYVCFVLLGGDVTAEEEQGDEAVIAHCQEQNQRVLDIISEKTAQ
jgi:hypothetical protein